MQCNTHGIHTLCLGCMSCAREQHTFCLLQSYQSCMISTRVPGILARPSVNPYLTQPLSSRLQCKRLASFRPCMILSGHPAERAARPITEQMGPSNCTFLTVCLPWRSVGPEFSLVLITQRGMNAPDVTAAQIVSRKHTS